MGREREVGIGRLEIQKKCMLCGKGVAHDNNLMFYRVTLERFMLDARAINTVAGLEMQFGGSQMGMALADVFAPDSALAKRVYSRQPFLVCDPCAAGVDREHLFPLVYTGDTPKLGLWERLRMWWRPVRVVEKPVPFPGRVLIASLDEQVGVREEREKQVKIEWEEKQAAKRAAEPRVHEEPVEVS